MDINKIYCENCLDTMKRMPDNFIDLVVTSPPYDNLRDYKGYSFPFEEIAQELFRVVKHGGVVVWVVADATINGSESGTSFRQALYFMQCGFKLYDTMFYGKENPLPLNHNRYEQQVEYAFILSKNLPKSFNPILEKSKNAGKKNTGNMRNGGNDLLTKKHGAGKPILEVRKRGNIWYYPVGVDSDSKGAHPAIFPEQLAADHIYSWRNAGDLVYDPFMGSGTTGKMAILMDRNYIGSEMSSEYVAIAEKRIALHKSQTKLAL